ncbi:esterase-like activity of phytase family protein [uncultured Amnibacterium sp.]|uniref:esterase-like activity of phytase family protein n=1 Tax=uncultured Amnibacterium sp. TaxID=1631851 RepID=UPI0035CBEF61
MRRPARIALLTCGLTALVAVGSALPGQAAAVKQHLPAGIRLSYLGERELPNALQFQGTTVGGLSAISYDAKRKQYLLISDDRSAKNPARFYTARIAATAAGLQSVTLTGTHPFLQPDGSVFPPTVTTNGVTTSLAPDPEGLAVDPKHDRFTWSSEGERIVSTTAPAVLEDPWVRTTTLSGSDAGQYALVPQLHMNPQQVGPRQNQTLEGLSFTPNGRELWSAMEDPLYQDGADPTPARGALVRVTQLDPKRHLPVAQYAYPLQPLFAQPPAAEPTDTNGLSDIAALGGGRFLVIERAFVAGVDRIRIYLADDHAATDILARDSTASAHVTPMHKRLLVDLADVKGLPRIDNVEGITLGPRLKDGRRLLLLVSDDNFSPSQVTQFIAFAAKGL